MFVMHEANTVQKDKNDVIKINWFSDLAKEVIMELSLEMLPRSVLLFDLEKDTNLPEETSQLILPKKALDTGKSDTDNI